MDSNQMKRILAGLSIAGFLTGVTVAPGHAASG
ncbi:MAG TPA: SbtA family thio(seleno)oxazole RiPP natural product precursor [Dissulfurispiraceae bacterium]|nr:SbtA family thio(seleno)oxazole RiPP natural product precursor [Dissulfurispiraceae bacterium]